MTIDLGLSSLPGGSFVELPRKAANQRHFVIQDEKVLRQLFNWANQREYYLCNLFVTDDRLLVDRAFKIYYILSGTENEFIFLEYFVPDAALVTYRSIADIFSNAYPLEQEIYDMFGLVGQNPDEGKVQAGFILQEETYPPEFYPLRRRRTLSNLLTRLGEFASSEKKQAAVHLPDGMLIVPVGPIHAGIIEAGHFPFHVAGEVIEELPLRLGYKHRGIEKLFETNYTLQTGWKLAEKVSGNSSVAHAIAYCQAVENLTQIELPSVIYEWRALFLELERMYNHISDIGLLATGLAYEQAASSLATLRELFVHFINLPLSGNRFLRGLNQPGGVLPNSSINLFDLYNTVEAITEEALGWGKKLMESQACRERMLTTGMLTKQEACYATGLVSRASGWYQHDFRLRHPSPAYASPDIQQCLQETLTPEETPSTRLAPVYQHDLKGDVFARLSIRVAELETSLHLVERFIEKLSHTKSILEPATSLETNLARVQEMSMGLGYAEEWRGDVVYVIFKGMDNTIARCKVRDPSTFNWHVFPKAVQLKQDQDNEDNKLLENILADLPLINKSFNLSYAGHDL